MQQKQTAGFIVIAFIILGILGILSAIAIPHAGDMAYQANAEKKENEHIRIQAAVAEMLRESPAGKLISTGPTSDLNKVITADAEPLVLADYLYTETGPVLDSGYSYQFSADGIVIQTKKQ